MSPIARLFTFSFCLLLALVSGCRTKPKLVARTGFLEVPGGKIWYRVYGEGNQTPVLMLHGGPGYPSYYLHPLTALQAERPVIMFDQLGCGKSDRITDTTLMTIDAYVEQTKMLLEHLGVGEFYLYGHSWGSMLATDYYLAHPEGIKALILASPCLSAQRWVADSDILIASLPDSTAMVLKNFTRGMPVDTPAFWNAMSVYYENFYNHTTPLPEFAPYLDSAVQQMGMNEYEYMWGPNEFMATGTLKNYDRTKDLGRINIPTLYITGEFDPAQPGTVKYYQSLTPGATLIIIPNAGHSAMNDNSEVNLSAISDFLKLQE